MAPLCVLKGQAYCDTVQPAECVVRQFNSISNTFIMATRSCHTPSYQESIKCDFRD